MSIRLLLHPGSGQMEDQPMKSQEHKMAMLALAVLLLLSLSHFHVVEAQTNTGTISGVISDSAGAGIPDAQVTATNAENGTTTRAISQENGEYRIASLLPGTYRVSVEKSGFKVSTSDSVQLVFGGAVVLDVPLTIGNVTESVEVQSLAVEINTTQAEVATSLEEKVIKELPLQVGGNRRQIESFVFLVPGVQGDTFS
ncbi:MAG: carboxypeptidase-like regulatory domain-containing protein, partial [Pyrinomonadaceae bacterium]